MLKLLLPALLLAGAAQAAEPVVQTDYVAVSYRDLDLRSAQGVASLDRRIGAAINRLCTDFARLPLEQQKEMVRCFREAEASVGAQRAIILMKAGAPALAYAGDR